MLDVKTYTMKVVLLGLCISYSCNVYADTPKKTVDFRYCYESRELMPHFTGNSLTVPKKSPGAAIEILQQLDTLTESVRITYIREPWKRCLKDLASGDIDGIVGSFSDARAKYAVFPMKSNQPNTEKAFSLTKTCLVQVANKTPIISWPRKASATYPTLVIAVPRGYHIISRLKDYGFGIYETVSEEQAYELLYNHRVDGSISACKTKTLRENIKILAPPVSIHYGYLMFSQAFYQKNEKQAQALWNGLQTIDNDKYYKKYQ